MKFCVSSRPQNSSSTSAESSGVMPRRSASSSVICWTSSSGRRAEPPWPAPRPRQPAGSPPCARRRGSPLRGAALLRSRFPAPPRPVPFPDSFRGFGHDRSGRRPLLRVNPALQQARALRRFALDVPRHLLVDLQIAHAARDRSAPARACPMPGAKRRTSTPCWLLFAGCAPASAAPARRMAGRTANATTTKSPTSSAAYFTSIGELSASSEAARRRQAAPDR